MRLSLALISDAFHLLIVFSEIPCCRRSVSDRTDVERVRSKITTLNRAKTKARSVPNLRCPMRNVLEPPAIHFYNTLLCALQREKPWQTKRRRRKIEAADLV